MGSIPATLVLLFSQQQFVFYKRRKTIKNFKPTNRFKVNQKHINFKTTPNIINPLLSTDFEILNKKLLDNIHNTSDLGSSDVLTQHRMNWKLFRMFKLNTKVQRLMISNQSSIKFQKKP